IISPSRVKMYYEQHTNDFKEPEKLKLRMIRLDEPKEEEEAARVRTKAQEILTRLREGADFAELAKLYSDEKLFKDQGGEHGWVERTGLGKELAEAASILKRGQISDVIETPDACWIILV